MEKKRTKRTCTKKEEKKRSHWHLDLFVYTQILLITLRLFRSSTAVDGALGAKRTTRRWSVSFCRTSSESTERKKERQGRPDAS